MSTPSPGTERGPGCSDRFDHASPGGLDCPNSRHGDGALAERQQRTPDPGRERNPLGRPDAERHACRIVSTECVPGQHTEPSDSRADHNGTTGDAAFNHARDVVLSRATPL